MGPLHTALNVASGLATTVIDKVNTAITNAKDALDIGALVKSVKTEKPIKTNGTLPKGDASAFDKLAPLKTLLNFIPNVLKQLDLKAQYGHSLHMLMHRFSLDDKKFERFEGMDTEISNKELCKAAENFVKSEQSNIGSIDKHAVLKSIQNSYQSNHKDVHARLDKGEIVSIHTRWIPKDGKGGHSVGLVLFKDNEGQYFLIKCNRGLGVDDQKISLAIYKINKHENIDSAIAKISKNQNSIIKDGETYFTKGIDSELSLEPYPDANSNGIATKFQTKGVCSWASGKLLFAAAAYANLKKQGVEQKLSLDEAYKFYKSFTTTDRKEGIKEIKEWLNNKDLPDSMIKSIYGGVRLPTREEALIALVSNASSPRDLEVLKELKEFITPEIFAKAFLQAKDKSFVNLFYEFKDLVTPKLLLEAIEKSDNFNLDKKILLSMHSTTTILEAIEDHPQLKNDPKVQEKILAWANQKIQNEEMWTNPKPEEIAKLESVLVKFSDIPSFKNLINTVHSMAEKNRKDMTIELPKDFAKLESILKNPYSTPEQKAALASKITGAIYRLIENDFNSNNFNEIFNFINRNSALDSTAIIDKILAKPQGRDLLTRSFSTQPTDIRPAVENAVVSRAFYYYNFEMLEKLEKSLGPERLKGHIQNLRDSEKETIVKIYTGRVLEGIVPFNPKDFEMLEKLGIDLNKEITFTPTSRWANFGTTTLNKVRAEMGQQGLAGR